MPKTTSPSLCYVYCAVESVAMALPASGMPDGEPPRALPIDQSLTLIVSDVSAATYGAEVLEPKLADLDWVAAAGAAHHHVIEAIADSGAVVLPFRLFTLFSSDRKVLATFQGIRADMSRAFDRVRGKQEWVLRIGRPEPGRIAADAPQVTSASGTSFLKAKADAKRESAARAMRVQEDAVAAFESLEKLADDAKTRPVDAGGNLILDAAFLVLPDKVDALRDTLTARAERLLRDGCPVSLTGPWPPYSFASMDVTHE